MENMHNPFQDLEKFDGSSKFVPSKNLKRKVKGTHSLINTILQFVELFLGNFLKTIAHTFQRLQPPDDK